MLTGEFLRLPARRSPNHMAIIGSGRRLTYGEFDAEANRFAHGLLSLGADKGTKVAILSTNRPEYAIAYFGAARAGCLLAHLSVRSTVENLVFMLKKIGAEILFFESRFVETIKEARERLPDLKHVVLLDEPQSNPRIPSLSRLTKFTRGMPTHEPAVLIHDTDPLGITFTGGTTGSPKAVLVTHRARAASAHAAAMEFGLTDSDVVAATTPLFHSAGLFVWFAPAVMLGATIVMLPSWDAGAFVELAEREGITAAFFVPSQLNDLVSHPSFSREKLATLKNVGYAGAPMARALLERVQSAMPHVQFTENYGQSETCPITIRRPAHGQERLGTVGRPAFNIELEIVDAEGRPLPQGELGEIVTRGEQAFEGYYNDPEETAEAFRMGDGWLWTGDMGFLDEDGFLTLVDRSKDMLVSGGENIFPAEIENALYKHEAVAECAVFGIPDERWGEVPAAHVVLASDFFVTEEELINFCAARIPRHKRPRLVRFVDKLPRTPVGKIQKTVLREAYWGGREKKI